MSSLAPLQHLLGPRFVDEPERCRRYAIPERGAPGHTPAVLLPQDEAELAALLQAAQAARSPLVVSAGRTGLVGSDLQDMLRCIRCGACMNHCPVYQSVGGHAYGWVYPGPMGSVLTPSYIGLENALDLPHAATMCGACSVVCPVKIPLPDLLRKLREKQTQLGLRPWPERVAFRAWSWLAQRPRLYALATRIGVRALRLMANRDGLIGSLPFAGGWTRAKNGGRFMPAPAGKTFRELYAKHSGH